MIKDYKTKTSGPIKGTFLISKIDYKPFANKPGTFMACEFTDLSGSIKAIMWDGFSSYKTWLKNKSVVEVVGELSTFKEVSQIQVKSMAQAKTYDISQLIPSLPPDKIKEIESGLMTFQSKIKNEICEKIWAEILGNLRPQYMSCPGGVGEVHHNYIGGLAEHSYSMIRAGELIAQYQNLDSDIVLTGCLIHDIGKINSYHWDLVIEMSDAGRLLHHTFIGYGMLLDIARRLNIPMDDVTFLKLSHIIVAHHEDEGIRKTMFAEAHAVAQVDAMDAMVKHAINFSSIPENKDPNSNWTRFCSLTGRQYYVPSTQPKIETEAKAETDVLNDLFAD
jgi:3'-5' exoribonuclease